ERTLPFCAKRTRCTRVAGAFNGSCSTSRPVASAPPSKSASSRRSSARPGCLVSSSSWFNPSIMLPPVDRAQGGGQLRFIHSQRHERLEQELVSFALHRDRFPMNFVHEPQHV